MYCGKHPLVDLRERRCVHAVVESGGDILHLWHAGGLDDGQKEAFVGSVVPYDFGTPVVMSRRHGR